MRKLLAVVCAVASLPACGGGGSSNPTPVAAVPTPAPTPVPTPPPTFGPGQFRVNSRIPPGRYFSDPNGSGCYWERESGLGGGSNDIIANDFIGYDAPQLVVDILSSDLAFMGNADFIASAGPVLVSISASDLGFTNDGGCGTWTRSTLATEPSATSERRSSDTAAARRRHREMAGLQ